VARQIRTHVEAALREEEARREILVNSRNTMIFGLAKLAEYRDTDTGTHLERIASYAELLAEALRDRFDEIDDEWIRTLAIASSMHDIGKVGIPDRVLCKPGRLEDDERKVIEEHPGLGADTLRAIHEKLSHDPLLEMSVLIAIGHHERWDGRGYPNGLKGDEIALAARIISVADVYDALTSERVYKAAMSHDEAVRIIREGRGTQFDPAVVEAFDQVHQRFNEVRQRFHAEEPAVPSR
jgi:putative two-component system response regulator